MRKYYHSHPWLDCKILARLTGKLSNQKQSNFVEKFNEEIREVFEQLQSWIKFKTFDPQKLPKPKDQVISYNNEELT